MKNEKAKEMFIINKYVEVGFNYAGGVEEAKKRTDDPEYDDVLYVEVPAELRK